MFKLKRETDLALLLLAKLAGLPPRQYLGLENWTKEAGLPYRFLSKISRKLIQAKIIKSKEGRVGGYRLAKNPDQIVMAKVISLFEGPILPLTCSNCVSRCYCKHKNLMANLAHILEKKLNQVKLKDLC